MFSQGFRLLSAVILKLFARPEKREEKPTVSRARKIPLPFSLTQVHKKYLSPGHQGNFDQPLQMDNNLE
jgi:hypothetical protein